MKNLDGKPNWVTKRNLLSIIWCSIHVSILSIITVKIIGTPWEILWLIVVSIYMSFYWVLTNILLDKIVGYEIDNFDDE